MKSSVLLTAAALALAGCGADNRSSIEILGRATPSDPKACVFTAGGLNNLAPAGLYDVNLGGQYAVALYVQNNLVDPKSLTPDAVTAAKSWTADNVRLRLLSGASGEATIPVTSAQSLAPAGGSGTVIVPVLTAGMLPAVSAAVGGEVVLGVTLLGHTGDGASLDTYEWPFPLQICAGCINPTPTCPAGQTAVANTCPGNGQLGVPSCQ